MAVSDSAGTMAFPRPALDAGDGLVPAVRELVVTERVDLVLVGRPVALSGRVTEATRAADRFFADLEGQLVDVSLLQVDERLSTVAATRSLTDAGHRAREHRARVDSAAAALLLQSYLDARRGV